ncbi:MAG: RHS domain-containing protein [Sterolibacteriaceae bacterium]|nr:RHS domain-containing protein [Candidatus Methylophosphatis haderslevensis]
MEKRTPAHHTRYRYDGAGRLIEARKLAVTRSESAESGQPPQPPVRPLHTTRFDYDALGNLVAEHATDETSGRTHSLAHEHDLLGNRTRTLLPQIAGARTRRALNYLHYGSGHLHQINLAHLPEPAQGQAHTVEATHRLIADIERDALHREIGRSQGGLATEYALDPLGRRLGSWTHSALADADTYAARLAARAAAAWPAQDGLRKHYQYDTAGELRQRAHSQQGATRYDYDPIGRLLGAERNNGHTQAERFAYDPAGNLLDKPPAKGSTRGYVRDNLVRVFEDKRYDYDGHGRLAEKRSGKHTVQRFEWDDEHRLSAVHTTRISPMAKARPGKGAKADGAASATAHTTQTTRFEYDALGRRIAKTDAFGRTEFIWEGLRLIEERRGSSVVSYVYEAGSYVPLARIDATGEPTDAGGLGTTGDAPLSANDATHGIEPGTAGEVECGSGNESAAEPPPSNIYYFHTDQVGLPEELTDTQGHIRWRAAYKAWGNTLAERWETVDLKGEAVAFVEDDAQPAIEQNLRYQGQYLDRDTGLHYNTFRYYDPDIGRFISPDPIGLSGGTNLHGHAPNANRWIDPLGWDWNYYLTDSNGNIYYHGRASDNQSLSDVMYRHGKNVGNDGLGRMGPGDTINRTTPVGTPKDVVRGIENSGTRTDGVLGRGSDSVRGNIDQGISDRKLGTEAGRRRVGAANTHLEGRGAASARDLAPLESKTMQSRPARGGC